MVDFKFIPILFVPEMVNAINSDRKTQTRRLNGLEKINENPDDYQFDWVNFIIEYPFKFTQKSTFNNKLRLDGLKYQKAIKCPYGKAGDILWVRETWAYNCYSSRGGMYLYKADFIPEPVDWSWKPNIHMPKRACRMLLRVMSVKVQRLQDIDEDEARAEGVEVLPNGLFKDYIKQHCTYYLAFNSFKSLWMSINGLKSWKQNPWVWVIEFEQIKGDELTELLNLLNNQ